MEASLFFIISLSENNVFSEDLIHLSQRENIEIIKKDLIQVKENNENFMEIKRLDEPFNIYLYMTKIKIKNIKEKIFIKLSFDNKKLKSAKPIDIKKNEPIKFIYEISYVYDENFIVRCFNQNIDKFINDRFRLIKLKKFMIFKKYLEIHEKSKYIDNLLESTQNEIIQNTQIIDIEFLLSFLITLFGGKTKYSDIPKNFQLYFKLVISHFVNIEQIVIDKYNNIEYNEIIKILEKNKTDFKDKNLVLNLDLIILLFYQTNIKNEFKSFFEKIEYKREVVEYIIKHPKIFKNYNSSELKLIYDNADENQIDLILSVSSNFNEFINFICLNIEKIKNKKLYKFINLRNCPFPEENYDYLNLIKFIDLIIDKDIYFPSKQFIVLVEKLSLKDYGKLIQLKSIFIEHEKEWKVFEIIKKLNEAIHLTGKKFIDENKLDNLEIINFIQEDAKTYYNSYSNYNENFACLIGHINLDKIDNKFINKFIGKPYDYDYKMLMKNNYKIFINSIIKNVKSFKHLKILYKMFNLDEKQDKEIISEIINLLNSKGLENQLSMDELSNILGELFKYVQLINENNEISRLIKGIKFNFKNSGTNEIFINILNNNDLKLNKDVIDMLISSINKNIGILTYKGIITILNNFSSTDIQIQFLQKQGERIIAEEELYKIKMSDNLKFVYDLIKYGFFNQKFNNVRLIKNIRKFMQTQLNNLKEFNFSINQLILMKELNNEKNENENNLKKRLYIITLGDKFIIDDLYYSLTEKINLCYKVIEQIKEMVNIFSYYYPREEEETIYELQKTEKEINENPINKFPIKNKIISQFDNKFKKAHEINKLKDSKIFIEIFNKNKSTEKGDS